MNTPSGHVPTEAELRAEIERLAAMVNEPFTRCAVCNLPMIGRRRDPRTRTCSGRCRNQLYEQRKAKPPGINADASLILDRRAGSKTESRSEIVSDVPKSPGPGHPDANKIYRDTVQWPEYERSMILARIRPPWLQAARPAPGDSEPPDWAAIAGDD